MGTSALLPQQSGASQESRGSSGLQGTIGGKEQQPHVRATEETLSIWPSRMYDRSRICAARGGDSRREASGELHHLVKGEKAGRCTGWLGHYR